MTTLGWIVTCIGVLVFGFVAGFYVNEGINKETIQHTLIENSQKRMNDMIDISNLRHKLSGEHYENDCLEKKIDIFEKALVYATKKFDKGYKVPLMNESPVERLIRYVKALERNGDKIRVVSTGDYHVYGDDLTPRTVPVVVVGYLGWRYKLTYWGECCDPIKPTETWNEWHVCIDSCPHVYETLCISGKLNRDCLELKDVLMLVRQREWDRRKTKSGSFNDEKEV